MAAFFEPRTRAADPSSPSSARAGTIHLEIDGERLASIENGGALEVQVPSGPCQLQATTWFEAIGSRSELLSVVLHPGGRVNLRVRFKGSINGGLELIQTA